MKNNDINPKELNLNQLTMIPQDLEAAKERVRKAKIESEREEKEYQEKYGDEWKKQWMKDKMPDVGYSKIAKSINNAIYYGRQIGVFGNPRSLMEKRQKQDQRMRNLFHGKYDIWNLPDPENSDVADILINDAIKTGKWQELPDALQPIYHKRIKDPSSIS